MLVVNKKRIVHIVLLLLLFLYIGFGDSKKAQASTKYPYLIKVNKQCNTVTVYKKDSDGNYTKAVKAMVCSTGTATPTGTFTTQAKYRWKILSHDVWGQYSTRITGSILFHSVWYYEKDASTLSIRQYNRLGTTASAGCVRLTVEDAKWIYDNCAVGTTVVIYNSSNPGPLGKPDAIKINTYSWDPTDTGNSKNPWNNKKPTIKGTSNKTVLAGSTINFKDGVTAYDTCGNTITSSIKVDKSNLNLKKAGTYKVTYKVTDTLGRTTKKTIKVKVINPKNIKINGAKNQVYKYSKYKNKDLDDYVMKGISATSGSYTLNSKYLSYTSKVIQNDSEAKVIKITYIAKNPTNNKKTKKSITITLDKQAPTVTGDSLYMTSAQFKELKTQLKKKSYKQVTIKDNVTKTSKITVETTVTKVKDNVFRIRYKATDAVGNTSKSYQKVYILSSPKLSVSKKTVTVTSASEVTKETVLSNVKFTATDKNYTSKFKNQIKTKIETVEEGKEYKVTYSLTLGSKKLTATATYKVEDITQEDTTT